MLNSLLQKYLENTRAIKKTAEVTGDLIKNKTADKIERP